MDKNDFLHSLEEIVVDPMFIGDSVQDQAEEIANNTWLMSWVSFETKRNHFEKNIDQNGFFSY